MSDFGGQRWRPYLDQEARERRDEILNHLKTNYDGPSDFVKKKLMEEDALSLDEKIERAENEIQRRKQDLEKFKQIKREREQQDKLRDKKELLREKQKKLRDVQREDYGTEVDAWYNAASRAWKRCTKSADHAKTDHESAVEAFEDKGMSERVRAWKDRQMKKQVDVDQLVEDVERLQRQVAELNGGREEWFLDLDQTEVSA